MNQTQTLFWLTLACATAVVGCGLLALVAWRARLLAAKSSAQAAALDERLITAERKLENAAQQVSEQARRIAWLELRVRRGEAAGDAPTEAKPTGEARPSITEQRHRVLTLARRGMAAEMIAETLNVPYGEVELIIALSMAA
jgi:DNA-binding NarL/FixJ family response regulator